MEAYRDTTFLWTGRGDTIVYFTAFTKFGTLVTLVPNKYAVFVDSSDITPPDQDFPGIWDTIYYNNFEQSIDRNKQDEQQRRCPIQQFISIWIFCLAFKNLYYYMIKPIKNKRKTGCYKCNCQDKNNQHSKE